MNITSLQDYHQRNGVGGRLGLLDEEQPQRDQALADCNNDGDLRMINIIERELNFFNLHSIVILNVGGSEEIIERVLRLYRLFGWEVDFHYDEENPYFEFKTL